MEYRKLGSTGLEVSRLGFGAMRPPRLEGDYDTEGFVACMRRAFELGVNYVDTAYVYGNGKSEEHVAMAARGMREGLIISTKVPMGEGPGRPPDEWERMAGESVGRLGAVEILFVHDLKVAAFDGPNFAETVRRARKAVERGDARHLGVSTHAPVADAKRFLDTGIFEVVLVQHNLLNTAYGEVLAHAREKDIGTVVMGPVGGGLLAEPSEVLSGMSPREVASNAELALRFALSNPDVDCALSGMNTVPMVEENAAVASEDEPLSAEERDRLLAAVSERLDLGRKVCTQCGYCDHCPRGIDIKGVFGAYMRHVVWGMTDRARGDYARLVKRGSAAASDCAECGECEPRCPQGIPITRQMAEAAEFFGAGPGRDQERPAE